MYKRQLLLNPEPLSLDELCDTLQISKGSVSMNMRVANAEPLALIEYWAVDPDYDGQVFRSVWQDYRGNTEKDCDPLRVVTEACFQTPATPGPRRVCVRVVDVFGFEAEASATVALAS